jgi:hypothetical protein
VKTNAAWQWAQRTGEQLGLTALTRDNPFWNYHQKTGLARGPGIYAGERMRAPFENL